MTQVWSFPFLVYVRGVVLGPGLGGVKRRGLVGMKLQAGVRERNGTAAHVVYHPPLQYFHQNVSRSERKTIKTSEK